MANEKLKPCLNCKETKKPCACMRNKCVVCKEPVGNITFTVCDSCWNVEAATRDEIGNDIRLNRIEACAKRTLALLQEDRLLAKIEKLEKAVQLAINGMDSDSITLLGEYHTGLYCGLEDRGITDRYYACDYGYEKALEKVEEWVIETLREALKGGEK